MTFPENLLYSDSHEWVEFLEDGTAVIGLTDFAQQELGDIVFVNLPLDGDEVVKEEALGDVESVKAVSDIVSPVSGKVCEVNDELADAPEKINEAPYEAWLIKVADVTDKVDLLNASDYARLVKEEG